MAKTARNTNKKGWLITLEFDKKESSEKEAAMCFRFFDEIGKCKKPGNTLRPSMIWYDSSRGQEHQQALLRTSLSLAELAMFWPYGRLTGVEVADINEAIKQQRLPGKAAGSGNAP